MNVFVTMQL